MSNSDGLRVRKLVGENVRLIYGLSGQLIAEYNGSAGVLNKEYVYGPNGLVATIEPTAINSNGTRYTTSDHLGSPRVITNSSAGVVSRHDYMPFGDEIGSGIGGRTTAIGFGISDGQRQKFTAHERDVETGLDYMQARYYQSLQGRFTSADSVSGSVFNPQTMNLYAYVINNPLHYVDPTGHMLSDIGVYQTANPEVERRVARAEDQGVKNWVVGQQNAQGSPVDLRKDKTITGEVKKIRDKAKPLPKGETPELSDVKVIVGDTYNIADGGYIDAYGNEATGFTGTVTPVAYVALDQGGNIIEGNGIALTENVKTEQGEKPQSTKSLAPTPPGGVYIDLQSTRATSPLTVIKQAVFIGQFPQAQNTPATHIFRVGVNEIIKDPKAGTISIKLGPVAKIK